MRHGINNGRMVFSHKAVTPVIVAPNVRHAVPLRPLFRAPQDGARKQDRETNAAKRWPRAAAHAGTSKTGTTTFSRPRTTT